MPKPPNYIQRTKLDIARGKIKPKSNPAAIAKSNENIKKTMREAAAKAAAKRNSGPKSGKQ